ncbi:MAG: cache domain-containing protein [Desulfocapsaceae bacterium]|nr:cache domain-containing protein [Desulfocapsaceae bacterium]
MIVICEKCGLKYKVDPSKIKKDSARLTCKGCAYVITVGKPQFTAPALPSESAEKRMSGIEAGGSIGSFQDPLDSGDTGVNYLNLEGKKAGIGLNAKVIIMLLLVSLLPGVAYFAISFNQTNQRIYEETNRSGMQTTEYLVKQADEWVDKNARLITMVAGLPQMPSMNREAQEAIIKDVQKKYPWIYLIHVLDMTGMDISRSDDGPLTDYSMRRYFHECREGKEVSFENVIGRTNKKPGLMLAAPIRNDGQVVGILVFATSFDQLTQIVINWRQGQMGSVFIADKEGKVIVHQNESFIQDQKDFSAHPLVVAAQKKIKDLVEFKDSDNVEMIGFSRMTGLGWTLALEQNKNEAYSLLKKTQTGAIILFVATVIGIIITAYFASRAIVAPIRRLTDAANRISVGELSVQIARTSHDEIGDLADAITRMQDSIRLSIERLRRKKR